jgi:dihydrofolate reductase
MTFVRCSVFIATSLDGYIARPDGALDWLPGADGDTGGEDYGFHRFYASVDTLVVGRKTFEFARALPQWPYAGKRVVVLSRRFPAGPAAVGADALGSSLAPVELLARLAEQGARHAYVDGGRTIQAFLRAGLIQELTITRVPVLLGEGIPLFGPTGRDIRLDHLRTRTYANGFVQSSYALAGSGH